MMINLMYQAYGPGVAFVFSIALILTVATLVLTFLYFRKDLRLWMSRRLERWLYGMQSYWFDYEPECPDWADPDKWQQSLH